MCRAQRGISCRSPDGGVRSYTTGQQSAHITRTRVVLYRWHPWQGRAVSILNAVAKADQGVYRCVLAEAEQDRSLEIPQWMFDSAVCCRIAFAPTPSVSYQTLRELGRLIKSVRRLVEPVVLQAEHPAMPDSGGARARQERFSPSGSVGPVSLRDKEPDLGTAAGRGTHADGGASCAAAAPASSKPSRRARRQAGAR